MTAVHQPEVLTTRQRALCVIVPFCAAYFLSYLLRSINAVLSPVLMRELSLSATDLGLLTSTFFFAFALAQVPVGIALDRFGPRRVAASLMLVSALGSVLFSVGQDLAMLAVARALIGVGVSASLMAALKAFMDWYSPRAQPALIGLIMSAGAVGALSSSIPVNLALPILGWRGVFVLAAGISIAVSAWVFLKVPDRNGAHGHLSLREALSGVATIFRSPHFWRFAPQSALFTGTFMALQGLWVVPWLMNVNGYTRDVAAEHLFAIGMGMLCGQLGMALGMSRLQRRGVSPFHLMQVGLALMGVCELLAWFKVGPTVLVWAVWACAAATGSQMYGVVASHFPSNLAGRATTAINLMAFVGAFALQWGLGALIDAFGAAGCARDVAHQYSFAVMMVLQLLAYGQMAWPRQAARAARATA